MATAMQAAWRELPSRQRGFSLLEILVAFSVLALSLGVLMEIFSTALHGVSLSEQYSKAALVMESRLAALGTEIPLEEGSHSGSENEEYEWQLTVSPYAEAEDDGLAAQANLAPFVVDIRVHWDDFGVERQISVVTLRLTDKARR